MELPGSNDIYALCHPEYFEHVLVAEVDSFTKTEDYQQAFGNGLLSTDDSQWRTQRNTLQPLFYRDHIMDFADQMSMCTQRRLETWHEGQTHDIESEMKNLTFEILFSTLFGREVQPGEDAELREAADGINDWFVPSSWMLPNWIPTPARRRFKQSKSRLREEVRAIFADNREQSLTESKDILSQLRRVHNTDAGLSKKEIEDQLVTMVFAGYETTAVALAFAWYSLSDDPEIRREFHQELDMVLDGRTPTFNDLPELEVTERIVKETLRLFPPVHTIPRRTKRPVEFDGFHVPEGEEVHLAVLHAHRDPTIYANPTEFQPDRWKDDLEDEIHDFGYIPFGGGRRTCIGREFALLEAKIVLATIGQHFQLTADHTTDIELEPQITTQSKNGIPMTVQPREE
ncbi:cytochrome P450 [Halalkalicoccus jeotgali B3]|uniref:Cytochrome P450 n=2 Tax=Halalkalicoccus jeotgali TaxID=413810 RepID=D8JCI6_HALJB|nr:cytochrome P450 [Halalkalicoccus jeotgali B3]ELY41751.1 cytochrome P450 [Halalkalicoccus jeotgali B3]